MNYNFVFLRKQFKILPLLILTSLSFFYTFPLFSNSESSENVPASTRYIVGISKKHKFLWFRVAKVGSTSIKAVFKDNQVELPIKSEQFTFNPTKYKEYFKFAFVRNPWDRVVSCYSQKVENKNPKWAFYYGECFDKGFDYFVDFIDKKDLHTADRHIRLQTELIPVQEVDFIGRLESFNQDLNTVLRFIGLKEKKIPKKNSSNHAHYSQYYNEITKEIIRKKYQSDIEAFGYQFELLP
jgi:sulfotransferase famil protein